ncbi:MAG: polyprenol monophosphomannose synthase [Candidatus Gastranaerophilales bacterium]|nr:polyprenol monophosphomannose synthase [Candidatus Gastranaerophilales bacterium]
MTNEKTKVIIILPTYNESSNIKDFLEAVLNEIELIERNTFFEIKVLIIDDYSPDGTAKIVSELAKKQDKINILMNKNRGLGNAYIVGIEYAMANLSADVIMQMDSDFSHRPDEIKNLLKGIEEGYDFVIGSRYIKGGSIHRNWGYLRVLNSKIGNLFAHVIAGIQGVKDCTSGFRAIQVNILKEIDLPNTKTSGYGFLMEILLKSYKKNAKIKEIPIRFEERKSGLSKIRINDILEFITYSLKARFDK